MHSTVRKQQWQIRESSWVIIVVLMLPFLMVMMKLFNPYTSQITTFITEPLCFFIKTSWYGRNTWWYIQLWFQQFVSIQSAASTLCKDMCPVLLCWSSALIVSDNSDRSSHRWVITRIKNSPFRSVRKRLVPSALCVKRQSLFGRRWNWRGERKRMREV